MNTRSANTQTRQVVELLTRRLGVGRSWTSCGRIAAWVAVWALVLSAVVRPHLPVYTDRAHDADDPPSTVRYVGPISRTDFAGFIPPPRDESAFTVAWLGGSEVKLNAVSVPGELSQRVTMVGDRPLVIDSYHIIAPRPIDVIRAAESAKASGVDAIVIALNPAWTRSEWSVRDWTNLDVSNLGTLWSRRSTLSWAAALTAPSDVAWRTGRAAFDLVEAQTRLNTLANDELARVDLLREPDEPPVVVGDPRLPGGDASSFWLAQEYGPEILLDQDARVGALVTGIGVPTDEARFFADLLVDVLAEADVPVFMYAAPYSPESLTDPTFADQAAIGEAFWQAVADDITDPLIELEPRSLSEDFATPAPYIDTVHMKDAAPLADLLVGRLCSQWLAANPDWRCT